MMIDDRETRRYGNNSPLHNQVATYNGHRSVRLLHDNVGLATTAYSYGLSYDEVLEAAERLSLLWNLHLGVSTEELRRTQPPTEKMVVTVPCPCTMIEQDEDCPIGYPSLVCGVCDGKGHTTPDQVTALACEMIKIASDVGEPEDPFAAWESVSLIQSQNDHFRKALDKISGMIDDESADFDEAIETAAYALVLAKAQTSTAEGSAR
jgi:hypothetical protein